MNPDLKPMIEGALVGALLSGTIIILGCVFTNGSDNSQKFKVIDSYHSCDIVRYTDLTNRFHYFMDCKNGKSD